MILMNKFFSQQRLGEFAMKSKQNQKFFFLLIIIFIMFYGMYSNYKKKIERNSSIPKISEFLKTNSIA